MFISAYGCYTRDFARRIAARYSPAALRTRYLQTDRFICSFWRPVSVRQYNLTLDIDLAKHECEDVKDLGKTLRGFHKKDD